MFVHKEILMIYIKFKDFGPMRRPIGFYGVTKTQLIYYKSI